MGNKIETIRTERDKLDTMLRRFHEYPDEKKNPSKREQSRLLGQLQAYNHVLRLMGDSE